MTETVADILAKARFTGTLLPELPTSVRPTTEAGAYQAQQDLVERMLARNGSHRVGHKIACTNALAQRQLSVTKPFRGYLLSHSTVNSPAVLEANNYAMRIIEAEFAFRIDKDLPPSATPRSRAEIASAVGAVLPGIEIVDSRYTEWTTVGVFSLISDNACHAGWVKGAEIQDWKKFDLAAQPVQLFVNGKLFQEGSGAAVLGHPLNALEWLVNDLGAQGIGLKAGEYVTTGVTTGVYNAAAGDQITADFGPLGRVEVSFR